MGGSIDIKAIIKTANKKGIKSYKVNNTEKDLYSVTKKFLKII